MSVSLKTVLKYPLLHFTSRASNAFTEFIDALSGQRGLCQVHILKHQEVYKEKLINNHGVSLVVDVPYKDKSNVEHIHGTTSIPIKESLQRELCLIYRQGTTFSAKTNAFIKILTDHLAYILHEN